MDINGKVIIPIEYDRIEPINTIQNAFLVEKNGKKWYVYTDGKIFMK